MSCVDDLVRWIEAFAPSRLAEEWDNTGLLWGDPRTEVQRVMTCLTVTPTTAGEAIEAGVQLIVSHHPVLFKAVKRVRSDHPETGMLWSLARAGVSIVSPHTAFDNTDGGINDGLAARLGLDDIRPLRRFEPRSAAAGAFKVVIFTPRADVAAVLDAAFHAGAGRIGDYDECSFSTAGRGTFFGRPGTNPAVGRAGQRESVRELRVEVLCPGDRLTEVLAAIRSRHSYEEPAIDVYPLRAPPRDEGAGRLGVLPSPTTLRAFAAQVEQRLSSRGLQVVGEPGRSIGRVAIVCGAGDDFLGDACRAGADVLLTGEARFHRALEAEALGIALIVAGHHATERPGVEDLADRIAAAFPALSVWASRRESDPLRPMQ